MGITKTKVRTPGLLAAIALVACAIAAAASAQAQSFGGMNAVDLEAARDSYFQQADHDGDFALSSEEQLSALGASNADLFECWDEDGDGVCSYTEFLNSGEKVFSELDVNGDGRLSPEEVQSVQ